MITDIFLLVLEINLWNETKSLKNASNGMIYAKKMVVYLKYLHSIAMEYDNATKNF